MGDFYGPGVEVICICSSYTPLVNYAHITSRGAEKLLSSGCAGERRSRLREQLVSL